MSFTAEKIIEEKQEDLEQLQAAAEIENGVIADIIAFASTVSNNFLNVTDSSSDLKKLLDEIAAAEEAFSATHSFYKHVSDTMTDLPTDEDVPPFFDLTESIPWSMAKDIENDSDPRSLEALEANASSALSTLKMLADGVKNLTLTNLGPAESLQKGSDVTASSSQVAGSTMGDTKSKDPHPRSKFRCVTCGPYDSFCLCGYTDSHKMEALSNLDNNITQGLCSYLEISDSWMRLNIRIKFEHTQLKMKLSNSKIK